MIKNIVFFGKFNAGKSTLINSIFGRKVVLEKPIPTHIPPVCITYANTFSIKVYNNYNLVYGGEDWSEVESICQHRKVDKIEVFIPHMFLKYGLKIWDSPGIDDVHVEYTKAALDFFENKKKEIDLSYYLVATTAITKSDIDFLSEIYKNNKQVIILFSKADRNTDEEVKKIIIDFEKVIYEKIKIRPVIQAVSPRQIWNDSISKYFVESFELMFFEQEKEQTQKVLNDMNAVINLFNDSTKKIYDITRQIDNTGKIINDNSNYIETRILNKLNLLEANNIKKIEIALTDINFKNCNNKTEIINSINDSTKEINNSLKAIVSNIKSSQYKIEEQLENYNQNYSILFKNLDKRNNFLFYNMSNLVLRETRIIKYYSFFSFLILIIMLSKILNIW